MVAGGRVLGSPPARAVGAVPQSGPPCLEEEAVLRPVQGDAVDPVGAQVVGVSVDQGLEPVGAGEADRQDLPVVDRAVGEVEQPALPGSLGPLASGETSGGEGFGTPSLVHSLALLGDLNHELDVVADDGALSHSNSLSQTRNRVNSPSVQSFP